MVHVVSTVQGQGRVQWDSLRESHAPAPHLLRQAAAIMNWHMSATWWGSRAIIWVATSNWPWHTVLEQEVIGQVCHFHLMTSPLGPSWAFWAPDPSSLCIYRWDMVDRGKCALFHEWQDDAWWHPQPGPKAGDCEGGSWTTGKAANGKGWSHHEKWALQSWVTCMLTEWGCWPS